MTVLLFCLPISLLSRPRTKRWREEGEGQRELAELSRSVKWATDTGGERGRIKAIGERESSLLSFYLPLSHLVRPRTRTERARQEVKERKKDGTTVYIFRVVSERRGKGSFGVRNRPDNASPRTRGWSTCQRRG